MLRIEDIGALTWLDDAVGDGSIEGSKIEMTAPPSSDWFNDPTGRSRHASAPALVFVPTGDFQLAARVSVEFASAFDAGVLFVHETDEDYAKLCFEYSPDDDPMVVSVVTRELSDDANGPVIQGRTVWLRVSRMGSTYAFHHSLDGRRWAMTRLFCLRRRAATASVGFLAQSPTGDACRVVFDEVSYRNDTLADARDGS